MEQYYIPKKLDFECLRTCLDSYKCENIFIRYVGSQGGNNKVNEDLNERILDFKKSQTKLDFLIDSQKIYSFDLKPYKKNNMSFTLAYERKYPDGRIVMLGGGFDPYDKSLPEPHSSKLRHCFEANNISHLVEITFNGRVDLEFDSWKDKPNFKYWKVVPPKKA
jgi:hypothetical protein